MTERDLRELLLQRAAAAARNAHAPYSGFAVGAAVLGDDGNVYAGCNVENASHGATVCAERSAVCAAVVAGARKIRAVAVAAGDAPTPPCGICRQVLAEFADPETPIWFADGRGENAVTRTVGQLLPDAFRLEK